MSDKVDRDDDASGSRWARDDRERCEHAIDAHVRCMLVKDHDGLHAWRSGERTFEWG